MTDVVTRKSRRFMMLFSGMADSIALSFLPFSFRLSLNICQAFLSSRLKRLFWVSTLDDIARSLLPRFICNFSCLLGTVTPGQIDA